MAERYLTDKTNGAATSLSTKRNSRRLVDSRNYGMGCGKNQDDSPLWREMNQNHQT